jgi:hypothetical protein
MPDGYTLVCCSEKAKYFLAMRLDTISENQPDGQISSHLWRSRNPRKRFDPINLADFRYGRGFDD